MKKLLILLTIIFNSYLSHSQKKFYTQYPIITSNNLDSSADIGLSKSYLDSLKIPLPLSIPSMSYQITQANNGQILSFTSACIITVSTLIQPNFKCSIYQDGNTVSFLGSNIISMNAAFKIKLKNGHVLMECKKTGVANISGDLKQ